MISSAIAFRTVLLALLIGLIATRPCQAEAPSTRPTTGPVTAWSDPVNGIAVRIEQGTSVEKYGRHGGPIYVRIKNLSDHAIEMPLAAASGPSAYTVWISVNDRWEKVVPDAEEPGDIANSCTLEAGEDLLCPMPLHESKRARLAEAEKVVIDSGRTGNASDWSGHIETLAIADYIDDAAIAKIAKTLPMPHHLSIALARQPHYFPNGPPDELPFDGWQAANAEAFQEFMFYPDRDVAAFFDRQRNSTGDYQLQMYYAAAAGARGSNDAITVVAKRDRLDDFHTVEARASAIDFILRYGSGSDQLVNVAVDLLQDDRMVRDPHANQPWQVRVVVDGKPIFALGESKLNSARAAVLKLAEGPDVSEVLVNALGQNPDAKAEAALLRIARKEFTHRNDLAYDDTPLAAMRQLATRKCELVLPLLLDRLPEPDAIEALGDLGDPIVIPALKLIADGTTGADAKSADVTAKLTLIKLDPTNRLARLRKLLADPAASAVHYDVGRLLAKTSDPADVPALLEILHNDSDGWVACQAIEALSNIHSQAAIIGLIDALEHTKPREGNPMEPYTTERYDDIITARLRPITGESIGPDRGRWKNWWLDLGRNDPRFK